ncbi:DUF692 domain-containing protein [Lignipirellula cremea]|uniref:Xylose isomerase-like TIM barrel n=1 Tax=Lignipirellula cremea TaxID=2528010 RepID=A0A518DRH8_9BACT|nr:DUF692 domain-containing protein [Lignipirellula cremea]QDU94414.1 hypothetical protein Pla8534_22040 [Lignipirellula cremea]
MLPTIGYTLREHPRLASVDLMVDAVEIACRPADDPREFAQAVNTLEIDHVSLHAALPGGTAEESTPWLLLDALRHVCFESGAMAFSDRWVWNARLDSPAAFDRVTRRLEKVVQFFSPLGFFLKTTPPPNQPAGGLPGADQFARLLERTGCGWLLDLSHLEAVATRDGFLAGEFLEQVMPCAESVQIHLDGAGATWDLYRHALRAGQEKITAVFLQRTMPVADDAALPRDLWLARLAAEAALLERTVGAAVSASETQSGASSAGDAS